MWMHDHQKILRVVLAFIEMPHLKKMTMNTVSIKIL